MDTVLTASTVRKTFLGCLFTKEETADLEEGEIPEGCVKGEGIRTRAGFHPGRLEEAEAIVRRMIGDLDDAFLKTGGGGTSFLSMCNDKNGKQWGEHQNMDEFLCLALAMGKASYCMPRESWGMFPGSMPYVVFDPSAFFVQGKE